jgi:hypothetical protein
LGKTSLVETAELVYQKTEAEQLFVQKFTVLVVENKPLTCFVKRPRRAGTWKTNVPCVT